MSTAAEFPGRPSVEAPAPSFVARPEAAARGLGLRTWWTARRVVVLRIAIAVMLLAATPWLGYQFRRLLLEPGPMGAVDLVDRHTEVQEWFRGENVYALHDYSVYPPASYAILWPFVGWLDLTAARWLWAATTVVALGWLSGVIVQQSGARGRLERTVVALLPLSMYATGATIGNGQVGIHVLAALMTAVLLLDAHPAGWRADAAVGALAAFSLVKPTIAVPFLWPILFVAGRLRPLACALTAWAALTVGALAFQRDGLLAVLQGWNRRAIEGVSYGGYADLHTALAAVGLQRWDLPGSLLVLVALGVWTGRHRRADRWLVLGVAALASRLWAYHRWYDDVLILLPMVALFRETRRGTSVAEQAAAGVLFALGALVMLAPGGLYLLPPPWKGLYVASQVAVWLAMLGFLLQRAGARRAVHVRVGAPRP